MTKQEAIKLKSSIEQMVEAMPYIEEFQKQSAIVLKARYDSLIAVGFNDIQAISLCKSDK